MEQSANYRNILIIKPSALGDIVHALPAMASLRASFPKAKISWLVRRQFAPLLECVPGIDELILFDRKLMGDWWCSPKAFSALWHFLRKLRQTHFDLALDLQGLFRTAFFAYQTDSRKRMGMSIAREGAGLLYTHRVQPPPESVHLIDYYNRIIAEAGGRTLCTSCAIVPPDSAFVSVRDKLAAMGLADKPYAVLVPGSAHQSKCWPTERFAQIAGKMAQEWNLAAVGTGSQEEHSLVEQIRQRADVPVINLAGQTTIPELLALLKNTRLVISNDTGPGHIAEAMKVPTVLIFGHTNPMRVGPYGRIQDVAAVNPLDRGQMVESKNPAYAIANVSEQMVLEKIIQVTQKRPISK
jgi:lipopolysaccharide heptosyltransferase I